MHQFVIHAAPLDQFVESLKPGSPVRVPGTAVFMTSEAEGTPVVLLHHLKHNKVLHERVILVSVMTEEIPNVPDRDRVSTRELGHGFFQVIIRSGFMETPNVPDLLDALATRETGGPKLKIVPMETTYYLGRETLLPTGPSKMASWRKKLFILICFCQLNCLIEKPVDFTRKRII